MTSPVTLEAARLDLGLTLSDLWVRCLALGSNLTAASLEAYLLYEAAVPRGDHDVIVHALNEAYSDRGDDHPLAYSDG